LLAVVVAVVVCSPAKNKKEEKNAPAKAVANKGQAGKAGKAGAANNKKNQKQVKGKKGGKGGKLGKKAKGSNGQQLDDYSNYEEDYPIGSDDGYQDYNRKGERDDWDRDDEYDYLYDDSYEDWYDDWFGDEDEGCYSDWDQRNSNNVPLVFFIFIGDRGNSMEPGFGRGFGMIGIGGMGFGGGYGGGYGGNPYGPFPGAYPGANPGGFPGGFNSYGQQQPPMYGGGDYADHEYELGALQSKKGIVGKTKGAKPAASKTDKKVAKKAVTTTTTTTTKKPANKKNNKKG
jgi:hypothetical protein